MSEASSSRTATVPLSDLVEIDPEALPQTTDPGFTFHYIDISSASNGRLSLDGPPVRFADAPSRARRVVRNGDVLMSTVRPNLKAFAYCNLPPGEFVASTGFAVLRPKEETDSRFILNSILSDGVTRQIGKFVVGSNYPAINTTDVARLRVPGFSPGRQHRIAEILSTVDEAIEQTEAMIAKTQQIKNGLMHDLFTRGVTPDGHLRPPRHQAPELYKQSPLGWIPREWGIVVLGELAEIVSGITLGQSQPNDGVVVPYLRVANVQDGYVDLSEIKTIEADRNLVSKLLLKPGDILMNEGGDFDKLGRGTVWNGEIDPCIHQNHVFRVRPKSNAPSSRFIAYWSQSEFGKRYFVQSSKQSTNLASINSRQLKSFPVALPRSSEEASIDSALSSIDVRLETLQRQREKANLTKLGLMRDLLEMKGALFSTSRINGGERSNG